MIHSPPPRLPALRQRAPARPAVPGVNLPLVVNGIFDAAGNRVASAAPGQVLTITGANLGTPGFIYLKPSGFAALRSWTDARIYFVVPAPRAGDDAAHEWVEIRRATDTAASVITQQFAIAGAVPPPAPKPLFLQLSVPAVGLVPVRLTLSAPVAVDTPVSLTYRPPLPGAPASVTVLKGNTWAPFTVPAPPGVVAPAPQAVDAQLSGTTLTLGWFWLPPPAPPPPPPPQDDPRITGYEHPDGTPITSAAPADNDSLVITGQHFGAVPGEVDYVGLRCSVTHWEDNRIIVLLPTSAMQSFQGPAGPAAPSGAITVKRPDGRYMTSGPVWRVPTAPGAGRAVPGGSVEERLRGLEERLRKLERRR